jgi:hypothetical protein
MGASAIVGNCIFPSSLPSSVSCQLLSPTLEKSTLAIRPHRRRRDAAHRATECGPEFDETIDCAALAWRLSYLQSLLPPEADLAMRKHRRRRGIVSDEVGFRSSGPLLAPSASSLRRSKTAAMEGEADGRRARSAPSSRTVADAFPACRSGMTRQFHRK